MGSGIVIQTITQTSAVLGAFCLGLLWHLQQNLPAGTNAILYLLKYDWRGVDVQTAETMAFVTLSLCELFRAYTVRSERLSIFTIGVFSNRFMQYAVGFSIVLLLLVTGVPFLQPIFNTHFMSLDGMEYCGGAGADPSRFRGDFQSVFALEESGALARIFPGVETLAVDRARTERQERPAMRQRAITFVYGKPISRVL